MREGIQTLNCCVGANTGSKTMRPCRWGAKKLLRGMPNFCGRSVCMCAIGSMPVIVRHGGVGRCAQFFVAVPVVQPTVAWKAPTAAYA